MAEEMEMVLTLKKWRCGTYCQSDPVSRLKHGMKVAICSKMWFEVESRLNGQRHNPGWIQFRHDRFRITRWRENPYKDRNPKTLI